jgi:hypothetical protein
MSSTVSASVADPGSGAVSPPDPGLIPDFFDYDRD